MINDKTNFPDIFNDFQTPALHFYMTDVSF
jgi:hypothetical protein